VKEKYYRPVIAFAESTADRAQGLRALHPGAPRDALELLDTRHPGLMGKFGGHAMAAGLTLPKANIEAFGRAFEAVIGELVTPELLTGVLLTDGELLPDELTLELAELIRASGPWGQAFPEPLFDGEFVLVQQRLVGRSTSR
jgi:single-stranded-DNA-specific exonuclease